jgi:hypothetical protein
MYVIAHIYLLVMTGYCRQTEQSLRNIAMAAPDLIKCVPISDF